MTACLQETALVGGIANAMGASGSEPDYTPISREPRTTAITCGLKRLRTRDGDAAKPLLKAINALADDPEPTASSKLGGTSLRRLRVGVYRATYEIDGSRVSIKILMVGSTPL